MTSPIASSNFSCFNALSGSASCRSHPLALADAREACCRSPHSTPCPRFASTGGDQRGFHRGPRFFISLVEDLGIQDTTKRVRVNRMIRISPVRVIGADGSQLGILEVDAALRMAEEQGLDLVEVAATARPPVVRIMDYGKYKF